MISDKIMSIITQEVDNRTVAPSLSGKTEKLVHTAEYQLQGQLLPTELRDSVLTLSKYFNSQ